MKSVAIALFALAVVLAIPVSFAFWIAEGNDTIRARAYYCGYARGMKFVADKQGLNLGPVPFLGCEKFDDLEKAK